MNIRILSQQKPEIHTLQDYHIEQIQAVDKRLQLDAPLAEAEVLVGFPIELSQIKLKQAPNVKWIHSFSAGMDKVLTPEVKASGVLVSNSSGVHAIPIAEHVLGFVLLFAKQFYESRRNQEQRLWKPLKGITEIRDATMLVAGLGRIGTEIARVAAGAGLRVVAVDASRKEKPDFVEQLYPSTDLLKALPEADYVVLALPHTVETFHLFNAEKFRTMKQSAILINIGRGPVVHEQELVSALQEGVIAGAALDVAEQEPLPQESPLWNMENVVITPHHSSHTKQRMDRTIDLFCNNLKAYIAGESLPTQVDKQKGY